jgi:predicted RNA binding protein YcfA (HicA-like mRNA interferase family)
VSTWPATKARGVLAALHRIGWRIKRTTGSHNVLERAGWADYVFAFHDQDEIGPLPLQRSFRTYSMSDAKRREGELADSLGKQATVLGLDGTRLRAIYDFVRRDDRNAGLQLLPIYAEYARYRGERVWIILLNWEKLRHDEGGVGHMRVFVVAADRDKIRSFTTCN